MKYIPSIAFEEMSGSAKGVTAAKVRCRKYIRNHGYGGSTRTEFQSSVMGIFKQLSTSWKALSNAQILAWNKLASTQAGHSVLGSSSKISGADLFMRPNHATDTLWLHNTLYISLPIEQRTYADSTYTAWISGHGAIISNNQPKPAPFVGIGISWNFVQF